MRHSGGFGYYYKPEAIEIGVRRFRDRASMWTGFTDTIDTIISGQKDILRAQETKFQGLKRANKDAGGLVGIAAKDADARKIHGIKPTFLESLNPYGPSAADLQQVSGISLKFRVEKLETMDATINDPMASLNLTARQRAMSGRMWNKFEKAVQEGNTKKAERALKSSPFSFVEKTIARFTNKRKFSDIQAIEEGMRTAQTKIIPEIKRTHELRDIVRASIKADRRSVAKTIEKMVKKSDLGSILAHVSPEDTAASPELTLLKDVVQNSPSMNAKDIRKYLEQTNSTLSHADVKVAMETAQDHIQTARADIKKTKLETEVKVETLSRYSKKLSLMASRETQMSVGGKKRDIADMIQDLGDGKLSELDTAKLALRIERLESGGLIGREAATLIQDSIAVMSRPDFKPDDLPEAELDELIKTQRYAYYKMVGREALHTAGDWMQNASETIKNAAEAGAKHWNDFSFEQASAAFDEAVKKATHTVHSAYHSTFKTGKSGIFSSAVFSRKAKADESSAGKDRPETTIPLLAAPKDDSQNSSGPDIVA